MTPFSSRKKLHDLPGMTTLRARGVTVNADLFPFLYGMKDFFRYLDIRQSIFGLDPKEIAGFCLRIPRWDEIVFSGDHTRGADWRASDGTAGTASHDECHHQQQCGGLSDDPEVSAGPFHIYMVPLGLEGSGDRAWRQ